MELLAEAEITCPYCGETFPLLIDTSLAEQQMIEDCSVCCRPIELRISAHAGEVVAINVGV